MAVTRTLTNIPFARARTDLTWGPSAFLCRSAPGEAAALTFSTGASGRDDGSVADSVPPPQASPGPAARVLFTSIGPVLNERCDSVYDPQGDRMYTFHAPVKFRYTDGLLSLDIADDDAVTVTITERYIRDVRGVAHYSGPMETSRFPSPPSGWCSWYFYYHDLNEQEVVKNAEWMAKNLKQFGLEFIQIDDAWQGVGKGLGENRDWETIDTRFPHGMRWLADQIHALGFKAGLWLAPHGQSNRAFVDEFHDAFLWRKNGTSVGEDESNPDDVRKFSWEGRYIVDTSGPAGQTYMRRLFSRLAHDWDYDYFKIDGQPVVQRLYEEYRALFDNPDMTAAEAYRAGLRVIRETIGPNRFLLGCWGTPWWGVGLLNGSRTGGDVWLAWEGIRPALQCTWESYWSHGTVWYADPDAVCVRPPLPLEQARVWATVVGLTGQATLASDKMYELPDERVELLRRILPASNARPMDLYPAKQPDIVCLKVNDEAGPRDVIGVFNWSNHERDIAVSQADLGLPPGDYLIYDVWSRTLLGRFDRSTTLTIPATACRVFCIRPIERSKPTLIGTTRHITQGAVDVERYEARGSRIAGRSRIVGGDPYEIRFFLSPGTLPFILTRPSAQGAEVTLRTEGPVGVLTLTAAQNATVEWSVLYAIPGGAKSPAVEAPMLNAEPLGKTFSVRLRWNAVASAAGYRVYRDDRVIANTADTSFVDHDAPPGAGAAYRIAVMNWQGEEAKASETVRVEVPRAVDLYLEEIPPMNAEQQWGTLRAAQSVDGRPLTIAGQLYDHGLGTHAPSVVRYNLGGVYARFMATAGIDTETNGRGSVVFKVLADGQLLFESSVVKSDSPPVAIDLDVRGRRTLELRVDDAGDGMDHDHADWADARIRAAE